MDSDKQENSSFEKEIDKFLSRKVAEEEILSFIPYHNLKKYKFNRPDFKILKDENIIIWIDAKEKKKRYNIDNWPDFKKMNIPEHFAFIEDESTILRLACCGCYCFFVVKDNTTFPYLYYTYFLTDFLCMPKTRNNRTVENTLKGKWLLDLRWANKSNSIEEVMDFVILKQQQLPKLCGVSSENKIGSYKCYGQYVGDSILAGGIPRTQEHKTTDMGNK